MQLKHLVNQILDSSKTDFKTASVQMQKFLLADLVMALVQEFLSFAVHQKINFQAPKVEKKILYYTNTLKYF
jgi:K+-sensing histidine kinase KdpD